jgi:hypothetical protein
MAYHPDKCNVISVTRSKKPIEFDHQELLLVFGWKENFESSCLIRSVWHNSVVYVKEESVRPCQKLLKNPRPKYLFVLDKLSNWETNWKMAFHPDKCNVISVTRSKKPIEFHYTLHGHTLDHVTKAEYLGVTFSSDLKWMQLSFGLFQWHLYVLL